MGPYQVVVIRSSGLREPVDETHASLSVACIAAFTLSDHLIAAPLDDEHDPPIWVSVYQDERLELSVQVFPPVAGGRQAVA